jgi:hypothetical protein
MINDFTTESGSFWIEAAIDCLRAINDRMISVKCRHTNFNSYIKIKDRQQNCSAITYFLLPELLTALSVTQFEK